MENSSEIHEPIMDESAAQPVADIWRPVLREIVKGFIHKDYSLARGVRYVEPVSAAVAHQIETSIADYGETLAELPNETWRTSVSQWMQTHWEVLVDLWTVESGDSDLVLSVRVFPDAEGFRIEVDAVILPRFHGRFSLVQSHFPFEILLL